MSVPWEAFSGRFCWWEFRTPTSSDGLARSPSECARAPYFVAVADAHAAPAADVAPSPSPAPSACSAADVSPSSYLPYSSDPSPSPPLLHLKLPVWAILRPWHVGDMWGQFGQRGGG